MPVRIPMSSLPEPTVTSFMLPSVPSHVPARNLMVCRPAAEPFIEMSNVEFSVVVPNVREVSCAVELVRFMEIDPL